jgi:MOSC domain-containing protein YiiM
MMSASAGLRLWPGMASGSASALPLRPGGSSSPRSRTVDASGSSLAGTSESRARRSFVARSSSEWTWRQLWSPSSVAALSRAGGVEAIVIAPQAEAPMVRVHSAVARADRGLEGDRYFEKRGTFSNVHGRGYDLTLIEAEVLDSLELTTGRLAPEEARRNVVTRGIDLNALVGKPFTIGAVRCLGQRLCEPCAHLERLTARAGKPGTLRALIHKGGLRADLLNDGEIRVGDDITARRPKTQRRTRARPPKLLAANCSLADMSGNGRSRTCPDERCALCSFAEER